MTKPERDALVAAIRALPPYERTTLIIDVVEDSSALGQVRAERDALKKRAVELDTDLRQAGYVSRAEVEAAILATAEDVREELRAEHERVVAEHRTTRHELRNALGNLVEAMKISGSQPPPTVFKAFRDAEHTLALSAAPQASTKMCGYLIHDGQTTIGACERAHGHEGVHMRGDRIGAKLLSTESPPVAPDPASVAVEAFRAEVVRALQTSGNEPMKWLARELERRDGK